MSTTHTCHISKNTSLFLSGIYVEAKVCCWTILTATTKLAWTRMTVGRVARCFNRRTGILDESGVVYLNDRAEEVMDRLGVPIVRGYDITEGQSWATRPADGRYCLKKL